MPGKLQEVDSDLVRQASHWFEVGLSLDDSGLVPRAVSCIHMCEDRPFLFGLAVPAWYAARGMAFCGGGSVCDMVLCHSAIDADFDYSLPSRWWFESGAPLLHPRDGPLTAALRFGRQRILRLPQVRLTSYAGPCGGRCEPEVDWLVDAGAIQRFVGVLAGGDLFRGPAQGAEFDYDALDAFRGGHQSGSLRPLATPAS